MTERLALRLLHLQEREVAFCLAMNRLTRRPVAAFFAAVSWLGNGAFWLLLVPVLMALAPQAAPQLILWFAVSATIGTVVYTWIKRLTARARPCHAGVGIERLAKALDRYSFPSGHTLHAVSFTVLAGHGHPPLLWLLVPFTLLTAMSRVVLGLHYPTDVAAGAVMGYSLANAIVLWL